MSDDFAFKTLRAPAKRVHRLGLALNYGLDGPGLYLLRPDGYIAFRAPRLDTAALQSYLQRVFAAS
mgnify:CR=1 FL=1